MCKASHVSDRLKEILVLSQLVPKTYQWDGSGLSLCEDETTTATKTKETITIEPDNSKSVGGWSKKQLKRRREESNSDNQHQDSDDSDPYLFLVMVYDLLYGKGIKSGGTKAKLIRSKETELKEVNSRYAKPDVAKAGAENPAALLRYLRVNKSRISVEDVSKVSLWHNGVKSSATHVP